MIRTPTELRRALEAVPATETALPLDAISDSTSYLASDVALRSIEADTYWPKWHSPWWHMLLLFELGEARRIPERAVRAMVDGLNALRLHIFPIHPGELPADADPYRDYSCHCALGCMHQILTACGVDVASALPWVEPWFARYQMPDGGLNCDNAAYLVDGECPSSMVGTIAPFEAMLERPSPFVERAAAFLIERRLVLGSTTKHNADERARAPSWREPCFPRFYFYDTLRGASALARWAAITGHPLPLHAISEAVDDLVTRFPDGIVRVQRRAHESACSRVPTGDGTWTREPHATSFALLDATSALGTPSPATRQWTDTRRLLVELVERGLLEG